MKRFRQLENDFRNTTTIPYQNSPIRVDERKKSDRFKDNFKAEWNETLQLLRDIGNKVSLPENTPIWIDRKLSKGVVVDQFLHAYYYNIVRDPQNKIAIYGKTFTKT